MPLSERERRVLAELEDALTREDPRLARRLTVPAEAGPARHSRIRRILRFVGRRRT
jgi:hypothetical protein